MSKYILAVVFGVSLWAVMVSAMMILSGGL